MKLSSIKENKMYVFLRVYEADLISRIHDSNQQNAQNVPQTCILYSNYT